MRRRVSWRAATLAAVVLGCAAAGGTTVALAVARAHSSAPPPGVRVVTGASLAQARAPASARAAAAPLEATRAATIDAAGGPQILFRSTIPDKTFGKLAVAPLASPNETRALSSLTCDRVYYAAGNGLCLAAAGAFSSHYVAKIFDASFAVRKTISIPGIPSRARVSADGRLGALTTFVNGDSYAPGNFSTRTWIIRMATGKVIANIETFAVTRDGKRFFNQNFNFWGVTFAHDDNRFYATLGSGAHTYLVEGDIRARTMRVVTDHVECPSLSPDETRIAYKRSLNSHGSWRLYVLDLRTMREHPLAETNSVDDQVEWLDSSHVLYWRGTDIWVVRSDGGGKPRRLVVDASSPVVVRPR